MSDTDTDVQPDTDESPKPTRPTKAKRQVYRVRAYHEQVDPVNRKTLHEADTETAAKRYVETHHPRGAEVYVQHPNGYTEHYSADLAFQGDDGWSEWTEGDED